MKRFKHKEPQYTKFKYKNLFDLILDLKTDVDSGSHISCYSSNQGYYRWKCADSKKSYHIKQRDFNTNHIPKIIQSYLHDNSLYYMPYMPYNKLISWIKINSKIIQVLNNLTAFL
jgi:hypothetical protein